MYYYPTSLVIKKVLIEKCTGISFVYNTSLYVCHNQLVDNTFKDIATHDESFRQIVFTKKTMVSIMLDIK